MANLILDFTVPSGMRSTSAISECGRSSINDIRIAADCSRESREMASAMRALSARLTICVSCESAGSAKYSSSASGTTTPARADRRTASIRRLRAIVNIQAGAPAEAGSNCAAFRHTASRVSCAISSASSPLAPAFSIRPLTRGAKCSNSRLKASRSPCAAMRPIKSAHSTFALGLSLSYFRNCAGRNDAPIIDPKDFLAWEPRVIAPRRELMAVNDGPPRADHRGQRIFLAFWPSTPAKPRAYVMFSRFRVIRPRLEFV